MNFIYHNRGNPAYLSGETTLYREVKKRFPTTKIEEVRRFLSTLAHYNIHSEKNQTKKKIHPKFYTTAPFQSLSCDLAFFKGNKNIWLMCIDDHSNYKLAQFIGQKKTAKSVQNALEKLLKRIPSSVGQIRTDLGGEFSKLKGFLKEKNISYVGLDSYQKAYNAEKFIGDFRKIYRRYKTYTKHKDLHKIMPSIVNSMNKKYSRVLKMTPLEATNPLKSGLVFHNKYGNHFENKQFNSFPNSKYKVGDRVRIKDFRNAAEEKSTMVKKERNYSQTVFIVHSVIPDTWPQQYIIADEDGRVIRRRFIDRHLIIETK